MRLAMNFVLALGVLALMVANWAFRPDAARPNFEVMPQMAHSQRYNAFAANPNFSDGVTLHSPPPGTIPRAYMPLHYAASAQDAIRAGAELRSPIDLGSPQAQLRGATVFENYCAICHGASGMGDGTVTRRGVPPPPPLTAPHAMQIKDGQLFHILTFGQNNMPSYASQLSRQDRWNAIAYVRMLQATAAPRMAIQASPGASAAPKTAGGQP